LVDMGAYESPDEYTPSEAVSPSVIYVRSGAAPGGDGLSWEGAFDSIGAALEMLASGEIWVAAGRYRENVWMERSIALYGGFSGNEATRDERNWAANETIIDASGLEAPAVTGADGAILDGFTITGGKSNGLYCLGSSPELTNCTITGNTGSGAYCEAGSSATLANCTITGNSSSGLYCLQSSPKLTNCVITGNTADWGGGMYSLQSSPMLTNCTITGNSARILGGAMHSDNCSPAITNSIIRENNQTEIGGRIRATWSNVPSGYTGTGNINADPRFVRPWESGSGDLHLMLDSPCIDAGNPDLSYNDRSRPPGLGTESCDMGAYGGPGNSGWEEPKEPVAVREWMMY
ncbi:MAG: right-handed parallel beta-helix repeat-containing protein, partial [bacterium]